MLYLEITMTVIKIKIKHQLRGDKIVKCEIIKGSSGNPFQDSRTMVFGQEAIICLLEINLLYQIPCEELAISVI